ncbi:MAG: Gfo/Idh/MocA family oxidoreductase [Nitriliruptoraceae bacterium]
MTRIGVIGAGFMGTTHAQAWAATDATLAAVLAGPDTPPSRLADRFGAEAHEEFDAFLDAVDVVDVCAPTHLHAELGIAAARAGKHVICEKPLARTPEDGAAMVAACRDAGVQLLVAHVVRFFPEYVAAKAAVDRGVVGQPAVLRLSRTTFQPKKPADNWFVDPAKSGGLVFDLMVHDLDYALWVAGEVVSVVARSVKAARPAAGADHALAILRHANGVLSHVEGSWAYPPPHFRTRGEIAGDAAVVSWDSQRTDPVRAHLQQDEEGGDIPLAASTLAEDPYTTQIRHFLAVLRGEEEPLVTGEDGLAALRLAAAVARSVELGEVVAPEEVSA